MSFVEEACFLNPSENIKIDIVHVHVTRELSVIVLVHLLDKICLLSIKMVETVWITTHL